MWANWMAWLSGRPEKGVWMATELYLIRHGESVPNVEPVIGGMRGDAGLTDRGRQQAALLEERLRAERLGADQLYVSTLPRALETGAYVARALQLPMHGDDELQELRPGEADGLTVDEWRTRFRGEDPASEADPFQKFSPGGESWAGFLVRAGGALARLVARHPDETVVAVCHGGVLEASFHLAFGVGASGWRSRRSTPASLTGGTGLGPTARRSGRWSRSTTPPT